jgi:hypothetical protein
MRRALAILKYLPAVLCGLLVVAWVVSLSESFGITLPASEPGGSWIVGFSCGSIKHCLVFGERAFQFERYRNDVVIPSASGLGTFGQSIPWVAHETSCPISFVLTLLLPFSLAPFIHFRFPLWSYFAWTALVAAELAYYLR